MSEIALSEVVRNYVLVVVAVIGLGLAWWRASAAGRQAQGALRQAETARHVHATDVFTRAVALLQDEKLEIRLGAVYSLRHIAANYPELSNSVFDLLQTYVRKRTDAQGDKDPDADVRAIIEFLSERLARA